MKKTNVAKVCEAKIDSLVESITDKDVARLVKCDAIITGGAIASMLLGEKVNDFDIYFKTKECTLAVAKYYVAKFKADNGIDESDFAEGDKSPIRVQDYAEMTKEYMGRGHVGAINDEESEMLRKSKPFRDDGIDIFISSSGFVKGKKPGLVEVEDYADPTKTRMIEPKFWVRGMSSNAITLSNKTQLILRFYGDPEEIHTNYDFVHCTNYWTRKDGVVTSIEALEALLARNLVYNGSKYPICSLIRTRKFIKRGYMIDAGQYLKMAMQVSLLDLTDINVLKDQLTGVDSAYFSIIINACEKKLEEDPDWAIDHSYIVEIVNRIFG